MKISGYDLFYRKNQRVQIGALGQEALRSGFDGAFRDCRFVVHGQDEDG